MLEGGPNSTFRRRRDTLKCKQSWTRLQCNKRHPNTLQSFVLARVLMDQGQSRRCREVLVNGLTKRVDWGLDKYWMTFRNALKAMFFMLNKVAMSKDSKKGQVAHFLDITYLWQRFKLIGHALSPLRPMSVASFHVFISKTVFNRCQFM